MARVFTKEAVRIKKKTKMKIKREVARRRKKIIKIPLEFEVGENGQIERILVTLTETTKDRFKVDIKKRARKEFG